MRGLEFGFSKAIPNFAIAFTVFNMKKSRLVVGIVVLIWVFTATVVTQPIQKTSWKAINEQPVAKDSYPRVASFDNGDYIVVYAIRSVDQPEDSQISFKIFNADGSVKVQETAISPAQSCYAPNVITIGDVAVIAWRNRSSDSILLGQFNSSGAPFVPYFLVNHTGLFTNTVDALGLFAVDSVSFGLSLAPTFDSPNAQILYFQIGATSPFYQTSTIQAVDIPTAIHDPRVNTTYFFVPQNSTLYMVGNPGLKFDPVRSTTGISLVPDVFKYVVPFLVESPQVLLYLSVNFETIKFTISSTLNSNYGSTILFDVNTTRMLLPDALYMGSNYALLAHSSKNFSVGYQYVKVNSVGIGFSMIGSVVTEAPNSSDGVSMAKTRNDIVVTAYDPLRTKVMTKVLTFCGNLVLDFDEQCDSSSGCLPDSCTCMVGTQAKNGQCYSVCGNGIVTGNEDCDNSVGCDPVTCKCQAGYLPHTFDHTCVPTPADYVPKVGPSLDCLIINNDTLELFFSFVSLDTFDQTIPFGIMNNFIPNGLATNRPTFFATGTSLTYPVSPYNLNVSRTMTQFSWLLGSYNLTVDLSGDKPNALQCPRSAGFVITIATLDTLSITDVQTILLNIAHKYNISIDRLDATYRLSTAGSVTEPNIYSISVTVLASTCQNRVLKTLSNLKDGKQQLSSELTSGLNEKSPVIKDVTPTPTGVEVRGQHRDIPTGDVEPPATSDASILIERVNLSILTMMALLIL